MDLKSLLLLAAVLVISLSVGKLIKVYISGRMVGKKVDFLKDGFMYFYSERCPACKVMKEHIEELKKHSKVLEINVGTNEGLSIAKELGVLATPTILVVKDGIIVKSFVGVVKAERLLKEV
ncbi:thioredoxin family protein [Thermocrinis minervae]|uniref:Thioredoxin 1 n=1 Tax=Thermocrinis minervae TaxID=381751 RepID=A0A1M6SXF5_9AQUI|nr:thioredoxin family protein [Thermocrinis minervae]SHK49366.1 thioredoxin 1 [Thermocrinis minervae]